MSQASFLRLSSLPFCVCPPGCTLTAQTVYEPLDLSQLFSSAPLPRLLSPSVPCVAGLTSAPKSVLFLSSFTWQIIGAVNLRTRWERYGQIMGTVVKGGVNS